MDGYFELCNLKQQINHFTIKPSNHHPMTERLLQFIWQFQYFNKGELQTTSGESVRILFPGLLNANQGPDFSDAKIKIGNATWAGHVELHLKTSDWNRHGHQLDRNYHNVILHVVWEEDSKETASHVPVLQLKERVSKILLQQYEELMNSKGFIPCEKSIAGVKPIIIQSWKERLIVERLTRKSEIVKSFLKQNNNHWEETFWWLLARNFGIRINADAFEEMARSISVNILAKHKNQIHQLEALLLGQAGLLNKNFIDDYPAMLKKEYQFLKKKYNLQYIHQPVHFLRMRPGNFPTIRLAQLAMLVKDSSHLFSKIKEASKVEEIRNRLHVTANDYWHYHYRFEEASDYKKKNLGTAMADNILINTVCLVLFVYGLIQDEQKYRDKAVRWLEAIAAENNSITKGFQQRGLINKNACDSQAMIELKNEYCNQKRCLGCAIGNAILKSG